MQCDTELLGNYGLTSGTGARSETCKPRSIIGSSWKLVTEAALRHIVMMDIHREVQSEWSQPHSISDDVLPRYQTGKLNEPLIV